MLFLVLIVLLAFVCNVLFVVCICYGVVVFLCLS